MAYEFEIAEEYERLVSKLAGLKNSKDWESAHHEADQILLSILRLKHCKKAVEIYEKLEDNFWYA